MSPYNLTKRKGGEIRYPRYSTRALLYWKRRPYYKLEESISFDERYTFVLL